MKQLGLLRHISLFLLPMPIKGSSTSLESRSNAARFVASSSSACRNFYARVQLIAAHAHAANGRFADPDHLASNSVFFQKELCLSAEGRIRILYPSV